MNDDEKKEPKAITEFEQIFTSLKNELDVYSENLRLLHSKINQIVELNIPFENVEDKTQPNFTNAMYGELVRLEKYNQYFMAIINEVNKLV